MAAEYNVYTLAGELPTTKTYTRPGERLFYLRAPGVVKYDAAGEPVELCLFDVDILQQKGRQRADQEAYHVSELPALDVRQLPRDHLGRPALAGYLFECYTAEPSQERPGVYRVACGADGRAFWCECLGAKGHQQGSQCKHRDLITHLAELAPRQSAVTEANQ
jgi:hypothetical protein